VSELREISKTSFRTIKETEKKIFPNHTSIESVVCSVHCYDQRDIFHKSQSKQMTAILNETRGSCVNDQSTDVSAMVVLGNNRFFVHLSYVIICD
jgi:hypothetical protein